MFAIQPSDCVVKMIRAPIMKQKQTRSRTTRIYGDSESKERALRSYRTSFFAEWHSLQHSSLGTTVAVDLFKERPCGTFRSVPLCPVSGPAQ